MGRYEARHDEKRDFYRMAVDCPLTYRVTDTSVEGEALCRNLSAGGVLFESAAALEPGARFEFRIDPEGSLTGALQALAQVVRCEPATAEGVYLVAATIIEIQR